MSIITDWIIKRRLNQRHVSIDMDNMSKQQIEFIKVINTLNKNKVMVKIGEDGNTYIRMAGDENQGECFSLEWVKVKNIIQ